MNEKINQKTDRIQKIIEKYNKVVKLDIEAKRKKTKRAYGGVIRAEKGRLVEDIGKSIIQISWENISQNPDRIKILGKRFKIPIREEYIERLKNEEIRRYIQQNIDKFYYSYKPDITVFVDDKIALVMECKAYTENAMLKRVLVDFTLLKSLYPNIGFVLLQLESQLGGDYSEYTLGKFGSPSTHTLLSYFDIELHTITLLEGERKVDKPIHKKEFFKPLKRENLEKAIKVISDILKDRVEEL
ncbi:hypothetical protein HRbin19_00071 [bacterium HR19]|nr:hypothetical protein HRbin19_00071 [bacterium HR19]